MPLKYVRMPFGPTTTTGCRRGRPEQDCCSRSLPYNAGPGAHQSARAERKEQGLDPNVWLQNVETVAAARIPARRRSRNVSNIYNYYLTWKLRRISDTLRNFPCQFSPAAPGVTRVAGTIRVATGRAMTASFVS